MPNKPFPQFVAPMAAASVKEPFDSPDWIFEPKLDGYRAITVIDSTGKARLWSRNHLPLEPKFPKIQNAVNELKVRSAILDGEIEALDKDGVPLVYDLTAKICPQKCTTLRFNCNRQLVTSNSPLQFHSRHWGPPPQVLTLIFRKRVFCLAEH